jgi:hypothetical protein
MEVVVGVGIPMIIVCSMVDMNICVRINLTR